MADDGGTEEQSESGTEGRKLPNCSKIAYWLPTFCSCPAWEPIRKVSLLGVSVGKDVAEGRLHPGATRPGYNEPMAGRMLLATRCSLLAPRSVLIADVVRR